MTAWDILIDGGVPDGAIRPPPAPPLDVERLRRAFEEIASHADGLPATSREALLAWLGAFRHHWPQRFARVLGTSGDLVRDRLVQAGVDANRYLKLRRIAIANLARVL